MVVGGGVGGGGAEGDRILYYVCVLRGMHHPERNDGDENRCHLIYDIVVVVVTNNNHVPAEVMSILIKGCAILYSICLYARECVWAERVMHAIFA